MASNSNKQRRAAAKRRRQKRAPAKMGRPEYPVTRKLREQVELMAAHAIPQREIGLALNPPCSDLTLRRMFPKELARARPVYKSKIAGSLHMWLVGRPAVRDKRGRIVQSEVKPNIAMAIFQAKVVLGQKESRATKEDAITILEMFTPQILRGLSEVEIRTFQTLVAKAIEAAEVEAGAHAPAEDRPERLHS